MFRRFFTVDSNDDNYWLQLDLTDDSKGNHHIFQAIGKAISRWSVVEHFLSVIYCGFAAPLGGPMGLMPGFNAIASFDARLRVVSTLLTYTLDPRTEGNQEVLDIWTRLMATATKANKKRNKIAHGTLSEKYPQDGKGEACWVPFFDLTKVAMHDVRPRNRAKGAMPAEFISQSDVEKISEEFDTLIVQMRKFHAETLVPVRKSLEWNLLQNAPTSNPHPT